ncbi:Agamous-like MADS-box protein [Melia azedarach]|uniref:Agamous-like MADS-box protein n=1 Tax=Melia azedarach TaxID=155640 RepID=A0ACC1YRJ3_MELAZ|nr:Agamous-like MADS-box protein [Melia azedarach]
MGPPTGKGKRKIEIKKIEKQNLRMVTFSKRRQGLFKKAREYAESTGAEIAVLVFSPAGNPFVHGSPSFDAVVEKFLKGGNSGLKGVKNGECETEARGFLVGLEEKMNGCRSVEELATVKAELEEVRQKVLQRLTRFEEDEFVSSLLNC